MNRIRIIGPCGSGKTTLARRLSEEKDIPYYELDNFVWDRKEVSKQYPEAFRDEQLLKLLGTAEFGKLSTDKKGNASSFSRVRRECRER